MQLERCLIILGDLQEILDGDQRKFGGGYEDATVREVGEAWEAVNVLSDVFLDFVRGTRGILGRDN